MGYLAAGSFVRPPGPGHICQMEASWIIGILVFLLGASIGSFLNVVIYRLPRDESLLSPPSHCYSCGARLTFVDLIPVLSYLILRGRCRHCGATFSPRYMVVEAVTGALAVICWQTFGSEPYTVGVFAACAALLVVFFVDLDHMIIPDQCTAIVALFGISVDVYRLWTRGADYAIAFTEQIGADTLTLYLPRSLVGLVVGGGAFLFIGWLFETLLHKPALGMGDVKLAGAMGAVLGPGYALLSYFLLAIFIGATVSVLLMLLRLKRRGDYIPFGPMMALAAIVMLLYTEPITLWLLSWYGYSPG